jgi:hypothetical protein
MKNSLDKVPNARRYIKHANIASLSKGLNKKYLLDVRSDWMMEGKHVMDSDVGCCRHITRIF